MNKKLFIILGLLCTFGLAAKTVVRIETSLGNIDIEMRPDAAPITVNNFLNYIANNDFDRSFVHRSVPNFVIQGGGFAFDNSNLVSVRTRAPIQNEFSLTNKRGTIAMAKLGTDPNSATSQWFINLRDNNTGTVSNGNLDLQNEGFTVFGEVIEGMEVADAIAALPFITLPSGVLSSGDFNLTAFALQGVPINGDVPFNNKDHLVYTNISVIEQDIKLNSGLNGFWFNPLTPGQGIGIEILPSSKTAFFAWFTHDTETAEENVANKIANATNRWMSGGGQLNLEENSITFDLVVTSGGLFDSATEISNSEPNSIGSVKITFNDCSNALLEFSLFGLEITNSFNLTRISGENVDLCNQLSLKS